METLNSNWSEERTRQLESLYRDGLSFSLIAADIGVTRAAAIGKAHRMKLPRRLELAATKPNSRHVKSARKLRVRKQRERKVIVMETAPRPAFVPDPNRDYSCAIGALTDVTCRYPLWGISAPHEARLYCGVPNASVSTGEPYCPRHAALCGSPKG